MKRKAYQEPTMQIVKLEQQQHLLEGSGQAGLQDYPVEQEQDW